MKTETQIEMKTQTTELLQMEIAALRDAVNQHGETAALYAANAAWQDHAIADAEQAMVEADEKLHKAKALRAYWLWKAATEHADGEDAAHALKRAVERLNDTTTATTTATIAAEFSK